MDGLPGAPETDKCATNPYPSPWISPDGQISKARRELETVGGAALDKHRLVGGVDLTPS